MRRREKRRLRHQLQILGMLMTWYVLLCFFVFFCFFLWPFSGFKYLTYMPQTQVKAISCIFVGCVSVCVCVWWCAWPIETFLINSPVLHLFFSSRAAGHDVRREAMGASAADMQRNEKNAFIQPGQTKPIQLSIVHWSPTRRPLILCNWWCSVTACILHRTIWLNWCFPKFCMKD